MHCKAMRGNLVVGLLLALMMLTGCSQKPEDAIIGTWQIGTWQDNESGTTVTFAEDGYFYYSEEEYGAYQFLDDDTVSLEYRLRAGIFHFKFQGDTIILTPADGDDTILLTKIRD